MLIYRQSTGELFQDGSFLGVGYSGTDDGDGVREPGEGLNDPGAEPVRSVGPIPRGRWRLVALEDPHPTAGPYTIRLLPEPGVETYGRSGFLIHGDSIKSPGTASRGCIVLPRRVRELIWKSGDRDLLVIA